MTATVSAFRRSLNVKLDWVTATLVGLFAAFQLGTLYVVGLEFAPPETQTSNMAVSGKLFAILLVEVGVIVGLWRGWQYLPDWMQSIAKYAIAGAASGIVASFYLLVVYALARVGAAAAAGIYATSPFVLYALLKYTTLKSYTWIGFNLIAFGLGVGITVVASHELAPAALIPLMVALMAYDYAAVDLTDIMGDLIDFSSSLRIPNYLIIPSQRTLDLEAVTDYLAGDNEGSSESVAFIIGVGDFVLPTALVASAYIAHSGVSPAVAGGIIGTLAAAVTLRSALAGGGELPALPWLNSGAIGGYAAGTGVMLLI